MEFFLQDQTSSGVVRTGMGMANNNKYMMEVQTRKRLTEEQVGVLERSFRSNKKLEPELKNHLATKLNVPPRQVAIWYQNKRARWKTQSLELGYKALQLQLETVTAEKKRLERQLKHLQEELQNAHNTLFSLTNQHQQEAGAKTTFNHGDEHHHQLLIDEDDELFHLCMHV